MSNPLRFAHYNSDGSLIDDPKNRSDLDLSYVLRSTMGAQEASPSYTIIDPDIDISPRCTSQANISGGTGGVTFAPVIIEGEKWLKCSAVAAATTGSTAFNLAFDLPAFLYPVNCDNLVLEFYPPSPLGSPMQASLGVNGGFTIQASNMGASFVAAETFNPTSLTTGRTQVHYHRTIMNAVASGYSGESILQPWDVFKVTVFFSTSVVAGQELTFFLRSIKLGGAARKGRLSIIADDGYASFFQRGVPILQSYGLKSTAAIIPPRNNGIGFSTLFTTEKALKDYVAAGNFCVPHGPSAVDGPGNLFTGSLANATAAERVADMNYSRDWLQERGLLDPRGAACYIWPQGIFTKANGEPDLLEAAYAAGYRLARATKQYPTASLGEVFFNLRMLSRNNLYKLALPILGHTYAGASSTASDAAETTNVNRIISAIQNLAAARSDGILMLHQVVSPGGALAGGIAIETDRLNAIAAAIKVLVAAGTIEVVGMPELVNPKHLS